MSPSSAVEYYLGLFHLISNSKKVSNRATSRAKPGERRLSHKTKQTLTRCHDQSVDVDFTSREISISSLGRHRFPVSFHDIYRRTSHQHGKGSFSVFLRKHDVNFNHHSVKYCLNSDWFTT